MDFIKAMKSSLFTLSFLPTENSSIINNIKEEFYLVQYNSYLYLLDLKEGSAFLNMLNLSMVVLCVAILHILISLLFLIFYKTSKCNIIKKLLSLALASLTFGFYIGVYLECFLLICFVNFNEYTPKPRSKIYKLIVNSILNYNYNLTNGKSFIITYIISVWIVLFILLTLWQWCKSRNPASFEKQKYFRALIEGMKPKWIYRSYMLMFLIRRTLFCAVVFFCWSFSLTNKLIMYVSIQGVYFLYAIVLRPLQHKSENIMEIVNETFYSYYCSFLFFYNTESDWTDTVTDIYFWIMVSNNFIIILINFVSSIKKFIEIYRKCRNKDKLAPKMKDSSVSHLPNNNSNYIKTNKVKTSHLNTEKVPASPIDADASNSYISFIASKKNPKNSNLRPDFHPQHVKYYQREDLKEDNFSDEYGNDEIAIRRLEREHYNKTYEQKIEEFKRPKNYSERINQDVNFDF